MRQIIIKKSGDYRVEITNPGDEVHIVGKFLAQKDEKIDINLTIVHKAPHTRATTMLKGVAR
jgi:Fe-S cluster assembly scaffold protein SufB